MKDAIDKARGLVAWALTTIVVPTALRVLLDVVFTERRFERGLGTSQRDAEQQRSGCGVARGVPG